MSTDATSLYSRKNPFPGRLTTNRLLSAPGSGKEIRHFEIALTGSGLSYEVGDSAGIYPENDPALVAETIAALEADGDEIVPGLEEGAPSRPLRDALRKNYHITSPSKQFLEAIAARTEGESVLRDLMEDPLRKKDVEKYVSGMEIIDFLLAHPSIKFTTASSQASCASSSRACIPSRRASGCIPIRFT